MKALIRSYKGMFPIIEKDVFIAENAAIIGDVEVGAELRVDKGVRHGECGAEVFFIEKPVALVGNLQVAHQVEPVGDAVVVIGKCREDPFAAFVFVVAVIGRDFDG